MAAILPHLEHDDETTETEQLYWQCVTRAREQGLGQVDPICPSPQTVIDQAHSQLLNIAWTRKIIIEQLKGRVIQPWYDGNEVILRIQGDPVTGPLWNPMIKLWNTSLLSWTTKMAAPSFSLGAGSPTMGGSCPGATAAQSVVPDSRRWSAAKQVTQVLGIKPVKMTFSICEFCYAEKDQYAAASNQYHQIVRQAWARRALREDIKGNTVHPGSPQCAFVQLMIEVIENADYCRDGCRVDNNVVLPEPQHWRKWRFFRLHDSGDMFETAYLVGWKNIANHFHPANYRGPHQPIRFWAPTRIWAMGPKMVESVNEINTPVEGEETNLILRPSAYHIDQQGPGGQLGRTRLGPGWAATTVVLRHETVDEGRLQELYDWPCQAYASQDGPNCRKAEGLDQHGKKQRGCRTCWMHTDTRVNYTLH